MFHEFLFNKSKLCIPKCSIRDLLVKEVHGGSLILHFGINKTYNILHGHFFCRTCMMFISFVASVLNAKKINLDHNQMNCKLH